MRRSVVCSLAALVVGTLLLWSVGTSSSAPLTSFTGKSSTPSVTVGSKILHSIGSTQSLWTAAVLASPANADGTSESAAASVVLRSSSAPPLVRYPLSISVELIGDSTEFSAGYTTANFGPGISVGGAPAGGAGFVNVHSPTSALAEVTISAAAAPGPRPVIITTGSQRSIATFVVPSNPSVPVSRAEVRGFVRLGQTVFLDGTSSTIAQGANTAIETAADGQALTFHWTLAGVPTGSSARLSDENSAQPKLIPDKPGNYFVQLDVSDGSASTSTWAVFSTENTPPVASAGQDQFAAVGDVVRLNGSGSTDMDGDTLAYHWNVVSAPPETVAVLSNHAAVAPTFTVDADGDYLFRLDVSDGHGNTSSDTVLVSTVRSSPIADAGPPRRATLSESAELDGSASNDPAGRAITCSWKLLSRPQASNAQLNNAVPTRCTVKPTFTVDQSGLYVAQLLVSDPDGHEATATSSISTDTVPPIAAPTTDHDVNVGDTVNLNGNTAVDSSSSSISYAWSLLSKPPNSSAALIQPSSAQSRFIADQPGDYVAQLIVSDGSFASTPKTVMISAQVRDLATTGSVSRVSSNDVVPSRPSRTTRSQPVQISPSFINFSDHLLGSTSSAETVSISNPQSTALPVSNLQLVGANPGDFAFTPVTTSLTVPSQGSASITVTFTPTTMGARSAALRITDDTGQHELPLYGNGIAPQVSLVPSTLAIGKQLISTESQPVPVKISNTGTASLTINSVSITGLNSGDFSASAIATPITIQPQQSATITITFKPKTTGDESAMLMISDNTTDGSHSVSLTGTGIAPSISLSPTTLAFGGQLTGTPSNPTSFTISNTGTADLVISGLSISGTNAAEFALSAPPTLPITIQPGLNETLALVFTPAATGVRTASLTIAHNAVGSPTSVAFSGTGTAPGITPNPTSISFGDQLISTQSATQTLTLTNSGTAPLTINGLTFTGTNNTDFSFAAGFTPPTAAAPITVIPGNSTAVPLTFKPLAQGSRSATLAITGNANANVNLSGNSTAPDISVAPTSLAFGNQLSGTAGTPIPLTINNTGNADLVISGLSITGTNASDFALSNPPSLPITIKPGLNTTLAFTFTPGATGNRTASLAITHNASGSPSNVVLSGTGTAPGITPNPVAISFGDQLINTQSATQTLTLTNSGTAPLTINSVTINGTNNADFALVNGFTPPTQNSPITLAPGDSTGIPLSFKPAAEGTRSASLAIGGNASANVTLSGNGTAPHIGLSTTSIAFPNQQVESSSSPATITLTNTGTAPLTVSNVSLAGSNPGDFALGPITTPFTVSGGARNTVSVAFAPTMLGSRSAQISILSNVADSPSLVSLAGTGTGIPPQITPASIDFNDQVVDTTSAGSIISINNPHSTPLTVSSVQLLGTDPGDFTFTPSITSFTVPAQSNASITLKFSPAALGARSAILRIVDNTETTDIPLTGNGTAPAISVTPTSLSFGNQLSGTGSNPVTLTINNTGTADLVISGLSISGTNSSDFWLSTPPILPVTIRAGLNTSLAFVFTPGATGNRSASLAIVHNAAGSPMNITLSGTGTAPGITPNPAAISFGDQLVGTQSATQTLTLTNSGTAILIVNELTITGSNGTDFAFAAGFIPPTSSAPISITPGNSTTVPLTFKPLAVGNRSASLAITGNATANVTLSGNGTAPSISVGPTALAFGNQLSGTASNPITLTISNTGTADLVIASLSITGANASDFSLSSLPTLPLTIRAGLNASLSFIFTPTATGNRSASLTIAHNASGNPFTVPFSGTGTAPAITPSPATVTFADQLINTQSAPQTLTLTNSGTASLIINGMTIAGTNAADFDFASGFTPPTQTFPITVRAGNTITVPLTFKPLAQGTRSATLAVTGNASANVSLSGNGTAPTISVMPTTLAFGNQPRGTASNPSTLTITNSGTGVLVISNLTISGTNSGDFSFANAPSYPITIAAGTSGSIALVFTPITAATEGATLTITSNSSQTAVPLSGTGTVPQIALAPATTVAFGNQLLNTPSSASTVTITNPGTADLRITNIGIGGSNATDFALSQNPVYPIVVGPNGTFSVGVIFTPKTLTNETATLSFTDNAAGSPHTLSLTGSGVAPSIGPLSPVSFGNVNLGSTSSPATLTVRNPGTSPLHITSLSIGGTNASDFNTSTTPPIVVDANNGTATISLTFSPTATDLRNGILLITDDAAGSPHSVSLTGTGVGVPKFGVTPSSLDFGSIVDGNTTPSQALSITNTGSADMVVDHLIKTGANGSDFFYSVVGTHNNDFPATVTIGSTLTVSVFFKPSDPGGTRTATLQFQDASNNTMGSVSVSGVGIPTVPQISLSATSLSFPTTVSSRSSAPQTVVVTNDGNKDLTISALTFTGKNAGDFSVTPTAPFIVPKSGGTATLSITFTPTAQGPRSATLAITNDAGNVVHDDTVSLSGTGRDLGRLSLQPAIVGKDLELLAIGSVDVAPSSDLSITITSSDPTKLLLSPLSTDPTGLNGGVASFVGILKKGKGVFGNGFPAFWLQALASSGTVQVTMTAPTYTPTTATITLTPSGFVLSSPIGVGANFTTQLNAADSSLTVSTVQLDSANNIVLTDQRVRGGLNVPVDIANGTPATGTISGTPVVIASGSGSSTTDAVKFHPTAVGTTLLSIIQPSGYATPQSGTQLTATVQSPSISLSSTLVGYNLEVLGFGSLNIPAPAGGLQVTLTSSDPTKVLLSTDPTLGGSNTLTVTIPAGSTTLPAYYIQGLASAGTATITATAIGYSNGVANVSLNPSGFVINSPNSLGQFTAGDFTTTTLSASTPLQVSVWQLSSSLVPVTMGQLRGGVSAPIQVVSGTTTTGTISGGTVTFHGGDSLQQGMSFLPSSSCLSPCTSALGVLHTADYATPSSGAQITATVTMPAIAIRLTQTTVGNNLEIAGSGSLDIPAPYDLPVTITSSNPNVLLSASATSVGSQTLTLTVPAGYGVNSIGFPNYYIQGLSNTGTALLTLSAAGFSPSTATVTLAPSGFVTDGPNGIGNDFGVILANGNVGLTIRAAVLDPNSLTPTVLYQAVRGGFSAVVDVISSDPAIATIIGTPAFVTSGNDSMPITLEPLSPGQAAINLGTPAGYSTPATGDHFTVTVN